MGLTLTAHFLLGPDDCGQMWPVVDDEDELVVQTWAGTQWAWYKLRFTAKCILRMTAQGLPHRQEALDIWNPSRDPPSCGIQGSTELRYTYTQCRIFSKMPPYRGGHVESAHDACLPIGELMDSVVYSQLASVKVQEAKKDRNPPGSPPTAACQAPTPPWQPRTEKRHH